MEYWGYQSNREVGASLLEVLIVMMIVSILCHVSMSTYQHVVGQNQLIQSVRETIAFLSYQRQQALLFNTKIKITLLLFPENKITATPITHLSLSQHQTSFQLASGLKLTKTTVSYFTFGERRQTLKPMSFIVANNESEVKIIISSLGRIRACSHQIKAFSPC